MPNPSAFRSLLSLLRPGLILLSTCRLLAAQDLVLTAPASQSRLPEVIELPLQEVRRYVKNPVDVGLENAQTHQPFTTQIYASVPGQPADTLLVALQMPASGRLMLNFVKRGPQSAAQPLVYGREAPERKDDFAWENQLVTYRVYGPALEATGEITSGIDVWSKRVPALVIDRFYKRDAEGARTHNPALSYHKDDGVGLDSYQVGPSRGCGGTGVLSGGKLWVSNNYTHLRILAAGPVRFEFELTYAPWNAGGLTVTETKRIALDAGAHLNKIRSTFTFPGRATVAAAAGLAIHTGADLTTLSDGRILSVWDTPQDPTAGRIATGLLTLPSTATHSETVDQQALLVFDVRSGQAFTYYAGSAWSKSDMPTAQSWNAYLQATLDQMAHPLALRWKDASGKKRGKP